MASSVEYQNIEKALMAMMLAGSTSVIVVSCYIISTNATKGIAKPASVMAFGATV